MSMSAADKEAHARAKTSYRHLVALEFRHPTFAAPFRICDSYSDFVLELEAGAPADGGDSVLFVGVACEIQADDQSDQVDSTAMIRIDGVSGIVQTLLANANGTVAPIDVTFRLYSVDSKTETAGDLISTPIHQQVRNISCNKETVSISVGYTNSANKPFPAQKYTSYTNPGLVS